MADESSFAGTLSRTVHWPFAPSAAWVSASYRIQSNAAAMIGMGAENAAGAANKSPVAVPMTGTAVVGVESTFDVAQRGWDPEAGTLTAYLPSSPAQGTSRIVTGKVGYTPQGGTVGQVHTVPVGVKDAALQSSTSIIRVSVTDGTAPGTFRSGMPWRTGAALVENPNLIAGFQTFRGNTPMDVMITYTGGAIWGKTGPLATADLQWAKVLASSKEKAGGLINTIMDKGISAIHCLAMMVKQEDGNFKMIAAGGRDTEHTTLANRLNGWLKDKPADYPKLYLCLGQEVSGSSYPWAFTSYSNGSTNSDFISANRRIMGLYKGILGTRIKICFNTLRNSGDLTNRYPGDDLIEVLTSDPYDNGFNASFFTKTKAAGFKKWCGTYDGKAKGYSGIQGLVEFAAAHGKPWGWQEWGPSRNLEDPLLPNGQANPAYIDPADRNPNNKWYMEGMRDFLDKYKSTCEFECIFNQIPEDHQIWPLGDYPLEQPSRAYRGLWRKTPLARPGGDNEWPP